MSADADDNDDESIVSPLRVGDTITILNVCMKVGVYDLNFYKAQSCYSQVSMLWILYFCFGF